ncbi:Lipoxygenase, C-terminal [Dillenia turbinata]|uniref:Lipoxygenase, C-terminal n=1 Tax=Dillenia turbinata TaxID=194707 RepID=A0AAN8ULB8_9MAGN
MLAGLSPVIIRCLQALENNKLFMLDHHDTLMPYLRKINMTSTKTYASRMILWDIKTIGHQTEPAASTRRPSWCCQTSIHSSGKWHLRSSLAAGQGLCHCE